MEGDHDGSNLPRYHGIDHKLAAIILAKLYISSKKNYFLNELNSAQGIARIALIIINTWVCLVNFNKLRISDEI